jgi:hypothetical protein
MSFSPLHCRCDIKTPAMTDGEGTTYYPKAGCLRFHRRLYNVRSFCDCFGKHFWEMLVSKRGDGGDITILPWARHRIVYLAIVRVDDGTAGMMVPMLSTVGKITPIVHVWRIQRAARRYIRRRLEERALAVAMSVHRRLGADSGLLAEIPCDIFRLILMSGPSEVP